LKALVLGAGGQLGSDLARLVPGAVALTREQLSVTDAAGLGVALERHRPDVVFNCAAYNPVDRAETEPEQALSVNSGGAFNVAAACRSLGVRLVHYSTNFVFDGRLDRPYLESDAVGPLGAYARSKAEGERRVLAEHPAALVIRTAALFGGDGSRAKGGSFPDRIVRAAREGKPLAVVADQKINPTYTRDLAEASIELAASGMAGLVHVVAAGCCGWDEFARAALTESGVDWPVESVSTSATAGVARRPLNGCLESERVQPLRPWIEGVRDWAVRSRQGA
jgi:dTDP-4-dehydrorhamnose reductase